MEVAIVECSREEHLDLEVGSDFQCTVFCIPREEMQAPKTLKLLPSSYELSTAHAKYCAFFTGDLGLGFIIGRLSSEHEVTFYTSRSHLDPFLAKNLPIHYLNEIDSGEAPIPKTREVPEDTTSMFLRQVEEKYRAAFLNNPLTRAAKKASVLAQIHNIADGVLASYRSKYPTLLEGCPSSDELSEKLFEDLRRKGVLLERLGQVEYFVQGTPQIAKQSTPVPSNRRLIYTLKQDTLHKYLEKFLMQPSVRASKEKSARAQLTNLAKGGVIALRTKYGANIDIPTEERLSSELFEGLVDLGAIITEGLSVRYSDTAIEDLASDIEAQEKLCEEVTRTAKPTAQPDLKTAILREALGKYYQKFLVSSATAAKTSKGVKEQIKNFVQGSVTSAMKSSPDICRAIPSVDDLTESLYRVLVTRKVVVTVGSGVRYGQDAIEALERDMGDMVLWEETAQPDRKVLQRLSGNVQKQVMLQCREHTKMTLGDVLDLAKRGVLAGLSFHPGSNASSLVPIQAKEVLFSLLESESDIHLPASSPSLADLRADLSSYLRLEVTIGDSEEDSPGA